MVKIHVRLGVGFRGCVTWSSKMINIQVRFLSWVSTWRSKIIKIFKLGELGSTMIHT